MLGLLGSDVPSVSLERLYSRFDGTCFWGHLTGERMVDEDDGRTLGLVGVIADITQRKLSEEAARRQAARYQALQETASEGIHILDEDGRLVEANQAFYAMLGHDSAEAAGQLCVTDWDAKFTPGQLREMLAGELPPVVETRHRRRDGTIIDVEITCRRVSWEGRRYIYAASRDTTARKALEDQLRRTNADLEQFAYVASHDLREPLRMVSAYLQLIERRLGGGLDGELKEFMDFAVGGARRMDRLILDLLEYSRTGRASSAFAPVALAEVVAQGLEHLTPAIAECGAEIRVADTLPTLAGDRGELLRLYQNLLGNSLKYRRPDRRPVIEVGGRRDGQEWLLWVRDNGIGIQDDERERAFGIFQRLVSRERYEGTGIGLAICRKVVEHHGGRIWMDSNPDGGLTVLFTLEPEYA
jgi:PAS domain S-box-containing protein